MPIKNIKPEYNLTIRQIINLIIQNWSVDAIYLYGSRAKNKANEKSDWDVAIIFTNYLEDLIDRNSRPQEVEAFLQRGLKLYDSLSIVDLEIAPLALQYNCIKGIKVYNRQVPHIIRVEHSIISKIEEIQFTHA